MSTRLSVQAVLVALLAWTALLCAGLGGAVGVVSQTFAAKLAASAQHPNQHGGTSLASRVVRGETPMVVAGQAAAGRATGSGPCRTRSDRPGRNWH